MSEFPARPLARPPTEPSTARSLETLATLLVVVLTVGVLYLGRDIFVPIAIAVLLSFVLSPLIRLVRHIGVGRMSSVWLVVIVTVAITVAVSALLTRQVSELAAELPRYQATVSVKIDRVRDAMSANPAFQKLSAAVGNLTRVAPAVRQPSADKTDAGNQAAQEPAGPRPVPVEVYEPAPGLLSIMRTIAGTALGPLATVGIVAVFLVFILLQREDLRDRFIRLAGANDLQRTTVAMNDAARRLSRYFLVQTLINTGFGVIITIGLAIIGVPSPILWGIVGLLMRFVPYIGSVVSAVFPIALAAAVDPGWTMVIATAALYGIVEPIMGQVVEPWLYGHHTGISPLAVITSATFWTWLWGPVGLLLSTPLTVCLVVIGRHVERLAFLDIIFGDAPPLTLVESFYQRMLAGDASEATQQAEQFLREHTLIEYYDEVVLQALMLAHIDVRRGVLDDARQIRIRDTVAEIVEDLSDHVVQDSPLPSGAPYSTLEDRPDAPHEDAVPRLPVLGPADLTAPWQSEHPVVCIAGSGPLDQASVLMLAQLLDKHGIKAKIESTDALNSAQIDRLATSDARLICLSYLDADFNPARARYAVRRLRRHAPEVRILVGFWMTQDNRPKLRELCEAAHADHCAARFSEALAFCLRAATQRSVQPERPTSVVA